MTFGIERSTTLHCTLLHPEKVSFHWRSVCDQPSLCSVQNSLSAREKRERLLLNVWTSSVWLDVLYMLLLLLWFGRLFPLTLSLFAALCCAELSCSLQCWTVLLDAVISSVHGQITVCSILSGGGLHDGEMAGGGARGREGERERGRDGGRLCTDLLLHKEDYLFINTPIWTFAIFGCLSSLCLCLRTYSINLMSV